MFKYISLSLIWKHVGMSNSVATSIVTGHLYLGVKPALPLFLSQFSLDFFPSPPPPRQVIDHRPQHVLSEITRYPKAGDPNPFVKVGVLDLSAPPPSEEGAPSGGEGSGITWVDLSGYEPEDLLVVSVSWLPRGSGTLVFQAQNKEQTWLDLNLACADTAGQTIKPKKKKIHLVLERAPALSPPLPSF